MKPTSKEPEAPSRLGFLALQVLGGAAVLGSYAHGLRTHDDPASVLWGDTPQSIRNVYTASMVAAAVGYFPFTYLWLRHGPKMRIGTRRAFPIVTGLYAMVLVPSALWMPLTFEAKSSGALLPYVAMRGVLYAVGAGSVGLLAALLRAEPRPSRALFASAVLGTGAFVFQTAVLDALVWPELVRLR